MNHHRWKVGDRARLRYVRGRVLIDNSFVPGAHGIWRPGLEVWIVEIRSGTESDRYDCSVDYHGRSTQILEPCAGLFDQLEPLIERGDWSGIERATGWGPLRQKVTTQV